MTHLSDFSFLQRMVSFGYLYIWYTYRVWTLDRFQCLHPKRFRQGELKSIVTLLILFMIPFQLFYDITSVRIKYDEGFVSLLGRIITKPELMWTKSDQNLVIPTEYSLCIGFSLQTGTLVLLQCFWNYLANSVAKASFMSSKEFMFYIFWTFASFIIFPVLQYNFSREIYQPTYKEIMPEMVYGIELFIVGCLGVVSHFRFRKLLQNSRDTINGRSITQKIRYFQEINLILSTVLFGHGTLLTILSCDGLTPRKTLNFHKFSADFFICNINMCAVITWLCMILIFHPKNSSINPNSDELFPEHDKASQSSTSDQSQTLANDSQITHDFGSYSKSTLNCNKAPSTISTFHENNSTSHFQFGPLPPAPPDLHQYGLPTGPVVPASDTASARTRRMSRVSQVSKDPSAFEVVVIGGKNIKKKNEGEKEVEEELMYPKKINYEGYVPPSLPYCKPRMVKEEEQGDIPKIAKPPHMNDADKEKLQMEKKVYAKLTTAKPRSRKNSINEKGKRSILNSPCHDDIGEFGNYSGQVNSVFTESDISLDPRFISKMNGANSSSSSSGHSSDNASESTNERYPSQFSIASCMIDEQK